MLSLLRRIVRCLVLLTVRVAHNSITHTRDWFNIFLGRHKFIYAETKGKQLAADSPRRIAIVALYPNRHITPFIINLVKGLVSNEFFVLAIASRKLPDSLSSPLLEHCHVLVERYPIGRDFGSYKLGLQWLRNRSLLEGADTLALVNDSLFYPASVDDTIRELLSQEVDWLGLFENYEIEYHVQSFFQVFRAPVFRSSAFVSYWERYMPLSSRTHFIEQGEKGLTRALRKAGFTPAAFYNSERIVRSIRERLFSERVGSDTFRKAYEALRESNPLGWLAYIKTVSAFEAIRKPNDYGSRTDPAHPSVIETTDQVHYSMDRLAVEVGRLAESKNPTHALAIVCNSLFGAPIKRDICLKGARLPLNEVVLASRGFTDPERNAMWHDLVKKGLPASISRMSWRAIKIAATIE